MLSEVPLRAPDRICAVIVTYHPDDGFALRLEKIVPQVACVFIVDNASSEAARARLEGLAVAGRVEIIALPENLGIGAALNRGLGRAADEGFEWAVTFDQDCRAHGNLVERLVAVRTEHPMRDRVAIVGANFEEETTGTTGEPKRATGGATWLDVDDVITSGCLQSLRTFRELGGYREDFFIYFVDTEYCWRASLAGYRVIQTREPLFLHRTGSYTRHRFFRRQYMTAHYAPWRHYYIVRNGFLLAGEEWKTDRAWAIRWARAVARRSAIALLFESDKVEKLRFMLRGAADAVRGRTGKLASDAPR
jgi:rhamnosyltransferase